MHKNCIFKIILAILVGYFVYNLLTVENTKNEEQLKKKVQQNKPLCPCANREGFEPEINFSDKISFTDYLNKIYKQQFKKD